LLAVLLAGALVLAGCPGNNGGGGEAALLPPETPVITAVEPDSGELTVTWGAAARAVSYDLAWAPVPADPDEEVDEGDKTIIPTITGLYHTITGLTNFDYYYVWVRAVNTSGISAWSAPYEASPTPNPAAIPANVQAAATGYSGQVQLTWDASANAVEYEVQFRYLPTGSWVVDAPTPVTATTMLFTGLVDGVTYEFQVRAVNAYDVWTSWSYPPVSAIPALFSQPGSVTVLTVSSVIGADDSLLVEWDAPADYIVQGYRIRFSATSVDPLVGYTYFGAGLHTATSVTVTGLTRETLYAVWVQAVSGPYYSDWSARGTGATYPFTQAYDVVVVGAGISGSVAVIGARSAGREHLTPTSHVAANVDPFAADPANWNDLSVLLLEKRHTWGGISNTSAANNLPGVAPIVNADGVAGAISEFGAWRTAYRTTLQGGTTDVNAAAYLPLSAYYPNWHKMFTLARQMRTVGTWARLRGAGGANATASIGEAQHVTTVMNRIQNNNIAEIRLDEQAMELITNAANEVIGVRTNEVVGTTPGGAPLGAAAGAHRGGNPVLGNPTGPEQRIAARKVILTTGGFMNMPAEQQVSSGLAAANPIAAQFAPIVRVNSYGTGVLMAMEIGAAIHDNYSALFGATLSHHLADITVGGQPWGNAFAFRGGLSFTSPMWRAAQIMVNGDGLRFRPENLWASNATAWDMINGGNWPVWAIFADGHLGLPADGHGNVAINPSGIGAGQTRRAALEAVHGYLTAGDPRRGELVRGDTLADLAAAMGLTGTAITDFVTEVQTYDAAVALALGDGDWVDPLTLEGHPNRIPFDGKPTGVANANLVRFNEGPFWAVRVYQSTFDSTGGLATDMWGRVLRNELPRAGGGLTGYTAPFSVGNVLPAVEADIIRNLYAAGGVANRSFFAYLYGGGTSITLYPTVGALAGLHAARSILGISHTLPVVVPGVDIPAVPFNQLNQ